MLGTELKICPFCGAKPNPPNFTLDQCGKYGALQCPECLALGPEVRAPYGTTEWQQIAADDWNRRAVPEPEQSDWERARKLGLLIVLGMMDGLGKRGETLADDAKQKVLEATDQYISAEFAEVRAEATAAERERCIQEIERRRVPNTEGCQDHTKGAMGRAMHAWASQELALLRDAIKGSR